MRSHHELSLLQQHHSPRSEQLPVLRGSGPVRARAFLRARAWVSAPFGLCASAGLCAAAGICASAGLSAASAAAAGQRPDHLSEMPLRGTGKDHRRPQLPAALPSASPRTRSGHHLCHRLSEGEDSLSALRNDDLLISPPPNPGRSFRGGFFFSRNRADPDGPRGGRIAFQSVAAAAPARQSIGRGGGPGPSAPIRTERVSLTECFPQGRVFSCFFAFSADFCLHF